MNTPNHPTDAQIHRMLGDEETAKLVERGFIARPIIRARIDPSISVSAMARALASEGLCMRTIPESLEFVITHAATSQDWHLDIDDDGRQSGRCPKCKSANVQPGRIKMICLDCGHSGVARS